MSRNWWEKLQWEPVPQEKNLNYNYQISESSVWELKTAGGPLLRGIPKLLWLSTPDTIVVLIVKSAEKFSHASWSKKMKVTICKYTFPFCYSKQGLCTNFFFNWVWLNVGFMRVEPTWVKRNTHLNPSLPIQSHISGRWDCETLLRSMAQWIGSLEDWGLTIGL